MRLTPFHSGFVIKVLPAAVLALGSYTAQATYCCNGHGHSSGPIEIEPENSTGDLVTGGSLALNGAQNTGGRLSGLGGSVLGAGPGTGGEAVGMRGNVMGANAGEMLGMPMGVWGSLSYSSAEDDLQLTRWDSDTSSILGGVDIRPSDDLVVGIALGWDTTDVETQFNRGNQDIKGWTIAPYMAYRFGELAGYDLVVDLSYGHSWIDIDQERTTGAATKVTSSVNGNRHFWSGNFTASTVYDKLYVNGRFGLLWANQSTDVFTESDATANAENHVSRAQWSLGAEMAYDMGGGWEPYVNLAYEADYNDTSPVIIVPVGQQGPSDDDDQVRAALGLRFFQDSGLSGSLEWDTVLGRDNYDEDTISAVLRMDME